MIADTQEALDNVRELSRRAFHVEKVPASVSADWRLRDGSLQHASGGFFSVVGVRSSGPQNPGRVLLYQPQAAITGLLYALHGGEQYFLLQARAEPGCIDEVQFGPTIQSTPANYLRLHGGAGHPYANAFVAFDPSVNIVLDTTQSDLGERYLMKSKRMIVAEYSGELEAYPGFVWVSASVISQVLVRSAYLNIDLRGLLALSGFCNAGGRSGFLPLSRGIRKSLQQDVRKDVVGSIFARGVPRSKGLDVVPLETLENWSVTDEGVFERTPKQNFSIEFYRVRAELREIGSWTQPLVNSSGRGRSALAVRAGPDGHELLVRVVHETGLALGWGLAPTVLQYPGAEQVAASFPTSAETLVSTTESDEGGRFFRDESGYEIFRAGDAETGQDPDLVWINCAELRLLLSMSNICTIQLRGLSSHLLALPEFE